MKQIKRLAALALAVMMLLSVAITASAAEPTQFTLTINPPQNSTATLDNHTYAVYQIFTGAVSTNEEGKKVLVDIEFGEDFQTVAEDEAALEVELEAELAKLKVMTGEQAAKYLEGKVDTTPHKTLSKELGFSVSVETGYYLIVDVSTNLPAGETSSAFVLELTNDTPVYSKHTAGQTVVKKIDDTNDSVDTTNKIEWHDSADHDIGDAIPFKLEMTVPSVFNEFVKYNEFVEDVEDKEKYRFVFHDVEEPGLRFLNDAKVYLGTAPLEGDVGATQLTSGFTVNTAPTDGCTFEVIFEDLTAIPGVQAGSVITVVYHSELTKDAVHGNQGNVNKVRGEFANLHRPEYPSYTPWDSVIAFTYKVVVNKYDDQKTPQRLPGAVFQLEKFIRSASGTDTFGGVSGTWTAQDAPVLTEADTVFTFTGLDDGHYRLKEVTPPTGYNSIEPIEFTVTANHSIVWENTERTKVLTSLTGNVVTGEISFSALDNNEGLTTDVVNKSGTVLPETGGIGTTIFYIAGGLMVLVAVVLLVTKKRMSTAE